MVRSARVAAHRVPWQDHPMVEAGCPECGGDFGALWQVTVGTDLKGYTPVFGGPVVLDMGRCNNCDMSFERIDAGPWRRQGSE